MDAQEIEKRSFPSSPVGSHIDSFKVKERTTDEIGCEEDSQSSVNEFGHGNATFLSGFFNVVCVVAGTGTLGLPHALAIGGWLGILIMILAFFMSVYNGTILIRCLYYKPGHRLHDYKEVGYAAYGWIGFTIATALHYLYLFGCPALYLVLAASNLHSLLEHTSGALSSAKWTIICGAVLLTPCLVTKTLKEVTLLAAVGAICTAIAVFVVLIQAPMDHNAHPERVVITDSVIWTGFPSALATIAFSYGGINTYPHMEHALKKPHQWRWVLLTGMSFCTALYLLTAIPGYWSYGRQTVSPVYNSLPDGTGKMISMIVMTVHVVLAIPIFTTSFSLEMEKVTKLGDRNLNRWVVWLMRSVIRTCTMVVLVILAVYVPFFDDFMGLIGAFSGCGLIFLLPVLCYLKLTGVRNKPIYELAFCALTLLLGVVGCIFGTIDAIKSLIKDFHAASS